MAGPWTLLALLLLPSPASIRAGDGASPVLNLKVDVQKRLFSWSIRNNVTWQECKIKTPEQPPTWKNASTEGGGRYSCRFPNAVLHRGAEFTISGSSSTGHDFQDSLILRNEGREGSAAVNFSCVIYAVHSMNCTWAPGSSAPTDVHYRLYFWTSWAQAETECVQYVLNAAGTAVGCHFARLAEPSSVIEDFFFLLNGTSTETAVPFLDFGPCHSMKMEKYNAPQNVRSHYNGSYHIIEWDDPQRRYKQSVHILLYEISLQRKDSTEPVFQRGEDRNVYLLPATEARAGISIRIRVKHVYSAHWSDWSRLLTFETEEPDSSRVHLMLIGPAVGAASLSITVLLFLYQRLSVQQKLFPRIPQVKRDLISSLDTQLEVTWEEAMAWPGAQEHEYVMLEEMRDPSRERRDGEDSPELQYAVTPSLLAHGAHIPAQRMGQRESHISLSISHPGHSGSEQLDSENPNSPECPSEKQDSENPNSA